MPMPKERGSGPAVCYWFQASRAVTRAYAGGRKRGLPMEEDKAAAYYDELSRKGEGAAKFKQGLGFSSSSSAPDLKRPPSAAASFLGNFVRASSPGKADDIQREAQLERIQNKLKKKPALLPPSKPSPSGGDGDADRRRTRRSRSRSRSRSRERYRDRRCSPGRETDRSPRRHHSQGRRREDEDEEKYRSRRRRRSRSRSGSEERERSRQSRHGDKRERGDYSSRRGRGSRSPPSSPESRAADRGRRDVNDEYGKKRENNRLRGRNASTDYSQLIEGYSQMTPAERVKAKMKFQLSKTVATDMAKGVTTGWERFQFDKEAPLDDEEIEVAEDDETLVKDIQRSFRYSAVEAKREEDVKAAHDQAMFGVPVASSLVPEKKETEEERGEKGASVQETLINDKARAIQGSWRDRLSKPQHGLGNADG